MTCGNCQHTDNMHYLSDPPKVKCLVTDKYRYYKDECDCTEAAAVRSELLAKLHENVNRPGAIMAINYDGPNAPSVAFGGTLTEDEAAVALTSYEKLLRLPLYGECDPVTVDKLEVPGYPGDAELWKLTAPVEYGSTPCLVCGEPVGIHVMFDDRHKICSTCKKAIKFIKERFKEELEKYCEDAN